MKEFKKGDKVAVIATVESIDSSIYSISALTSKDYGFNFTKDGKYSINDEFQTVFHLEDLKSEYPKWMMVKDDEDDEFIKRYVIGNHNERFVSVNKATTEKELKSNNTFLTWIFAKDIEPEPSENQLLQQEIEALIIKIDELKSRVYKLK